MNRTRTKLLAAGQPVARRHIAPPIARIEGRATLDLNARAPRGIEATP